MDTQTLIYSTYALAVLGALAVLLAMPRGRPPRRLAAALIGLSAVVGLVVLLCQRYGGDAGSRVTFALLTLLNLTAALRVVTHRKPVYAALYFVLVALSTVGLVVAAGAEFLGAALVIVYAGAILVTYVFVIMLAQQSQPGDQPIQGGPLDYDGNAREPVLATAAGFLLMAITAAMIVQRPWPAPPPLAEGGNTLALGSVLLTRYAISVELAGVLLLVAIIGAIALARKPVPTDALPPQPPQPAPGEVGRTVKPF